MKHGKKIVLMRALAIVCCDYRQLRKGLISGWAMRRAVWAGVTQLSHLCHLIVG